MVSERFPKYMSVAEYLAYEEETGVRYEYLDGEIFAMAGGSDRHSTIGLNCGGELRAQLRKKTCRAYNSDLKIKITDIKYVYPDFSVVCGDAQFADEKRTMLINPTFVGEVLSPSTADYDRGAKANFYRSLPSVQAYLLLDQDQPFAQLYTRQENAWLLREFSGIDSIIPLDEIDVQLSMREVYLDVFE
ncbi:MAG: Uma2 family endonuclease [Phototrophicaceae bacterium]